MDRAELEGKIRIIIENVLNEGICPDEDVLGGDIFLVKCNKDCADWDVEQIIEKVADLCNQHAIEFAKSVVPEKKIVKGCKHPEYEALVVAGFNKCIDEMNKRIEKLEG